VQEVTKAQPGVQRRTVRRRPKADAPAEPTARPQKPSRSYNTRSADPAPTSTVPTSSRTDVSFDSVLKFFEDGRLGIFLGVVMLLFAAYLLLASISYISNSSVDQSALLNASADILKERAPTIQNTTGWFGAFMSHFLVYRWLGLGGFVLIGYVGALGLSLVHLCNFKFWQLTFKSAVTAIAISLIVGLLTYNSPSSPTFWGGEHGYFINRFLIENASLWGALAVSIAMLTAMILIFIKPLAFFFSHLAKAFHGVKSSIAQRHDAAIEAARQTEIRQQAERAAERARAEQRLNKKEESINKREPIEENIEPAAQTTPVAAEQRHATERPQPKASIAEDNPETAPKPIPLDEVYTPLVPTLDDPLFASVPDVETRSADSPASAETKLTDIEHEMTKTEPEEKAPELNDLSSADETETSEITAADNTPTPALALSLDTTASLTEILPEQAEPSDVPSELPNYPEMTINAPELESDPDETDNIVENVTDTVEPSPATAASEIFDTPYDPRADLSHYRFPGLDLLCETEDDGATVDEEEQEANKVRIINILRSYGVEISSISATIGPTITLYEIVPAPGVRISKIKRLGDDVAMSLAAMGIRIIAPIPGKGTIGMEVPNKKPRVVRMRSILSSRAYRESKAQLPIALGSTISNEVYVTDLAKMPHLLVAGATGMGKSVGLNTIIASLLYRKHPAELKFVMVDPKRVEFSLYKCIERHYLAKLPEEESAIILESENAVTTLNSLCKEMEDRYTLLSEAGVRGIVEYNEKFSQRRLNPEKGHRYLPYIVVVIDEFADLILTVGKEVETPISRLAAKARAIGIHVILATQRPSVNVITGVIKANFPGRIAFRVTQRNDSQTILDRLGAE
ncbi:MAG: DNA translocase FtsK, partial [Paramuribaculum sp.]|nr:DNA translocase FtsK [Paramuribaculum sp.]